MHAALSTGVLLRSLCCLRIPDALIRTWTGVWSAARIKTFRPRICIHAGKQHHSNRVSDSGGMMDNIPAETCRKYAEICRLRAARHIDIEQSLLFSALTKICEQAAAVAESKAFADEQKAWPYG
jgi:hypothetical protein